MNELGKHERELVLQDLNTKGYELVRQIGFGAFSSVFLVTEKKEQVTTGTQAHKYNER